MTFKQWLENEEAKEIFKGICDSFGWVYETFHFGDFTVDGMHDTTWYHEQGEYDEGAGKYEYQEVTGPNVDEKISANGDYVLQGNQDVA